MITDGEEIYTDDETQNNQENQINSSNPTTNKQIDDKSGPKSFGKGRGNKQNRGNRQNWNNVQVPNKQGFTQPFFELKFFRRLKLKLWKAILLGSN